MKSFSAVVTECIEPQGQRASLLSLNTFFVHHYITNGRVAERSKALV